MIELLKTRIEANRTELSTLQGRHDAMVANFNQQVQLNQNRFNQLQGAIAELEFLLTQIAPGTNGEVERPEVNRLKQ